MQIAVPARLYTMSRAEWGTAACPGTCMRTCATGVMPVSVAAGITHPIVNAECCIFEWPLSYLQRRVARQWVLIGAFGVMHITICNIYYTVDAHMWPCHVACL